MARLTAAERKKMPARKFGQPKKKGFPMNDKKHQRLAISGATRAYRAGNISLSEKNRLQAEARRKLEGAPSAKKKVPAHKFKDTARPKKKVPAHKFKDTARPKKKTPARKLKRAARPKSVFGDSMMSARM